MSPTRRQVLVALGLVIGRTMGAAAQRPAPTPPPPRLPSGGFSPFRQKGFAGTSFGAAALEQPGCPLAVQVTALNRGDRGVTVTLQLNNLGEATVNRQVVGAWVLVPDGTIRGYQRWIGERAIEPTEYRAFDLILRTTTVMPDDLVVVAVQEATGAEAKPWRRDVKDLEREVREAITR